MDARPFWAPVSEAFRSPPVQGDLQELRKLASRVGAASRAAQRSLAKPGAHDNVTDHGQLPGWKNVERRLAAMGVTATFGPPPYEQIQWRLSRTPAFPKPMSRAEQMWTAHGQWLSGVKNAHRAKRTRAPNFDPKNPRWTISGLFTTLESLTNAVLMDRKDRLLRCVH